MSPCLERHPSTVSDWDDARRRARLRETRLGHGWQALRRTRLTLLRVAALLLAGVVLFAQYWSLDVAPERARLARTDPVVNSITQPADPKNWDTVVVDLVGLGNLDAAETAAALPALNRFGVVWAIRYDNEGIDTKVIADLIVLAMQRSGLRNVVLVGHSMGGVIALEVAEHIHLGSDRTLVAVILDCTPVDLNAVRADSRSRGENMLRLIGWLPGARESRTLRLIVETYARQERFVDRRREGLPGIRIGELRAVLAEVLHDKIFSTDVASNGLIEAQFAAIVAAGAGDDLRTLTREPDGKPRPAIVFIRPHNPDRDRVVDVEYSHQVLIDRVGGVDGTLSVVLTRTTGHADPRQHPEEYNRVIEQQVLPFVQRFQQRAREAPAAAAPR